MKLGYQDVGSAKGGQQPQGSLALSAVHRVQDGEPEEEPCRSQPSSVIRHLGPSVHRHCAEARRPDRVLPLAGARRGPDRLNMHIRSWRNCGDNIPAMRRPSAKHRRRAMDSLPPPRRNPVMARLGHPTVRALADPKLNPKKTLSSGLRNPKRTATLLPASWRTRKPKAKPSTTTR